MYIKKLRKIYCFCMWL